MTFEPQVLTKSATHVGNKFMDIKPIILCGGVGQRLTPLSTPELPKQFLPLAQGEPLFIQTCKRVRRLLPNKPLHIVTTLALEPLAQRYAPADACFLIEPLRRNTAAAVALAARHAKPDDILWIMPCDHLIEDETALSQALHKAHTLAAQGFIALLGIRPDFAHTGYGYIFSGPDGGTVHHFTEKPDKPLALRYLQSGDYWWNSGMIIARADTLLCEFTVHAPIFVNGTPYEALPSLPVDRVILEKTDRAMLVPANMGWQDIGGGDSLDLFKKTG